MRLGRPDRFDIVTLLVALLAPLLVSRPACAQAADPVTEFGLHLATLRLTAVGEGAGGLGAGLARDVLSWLSIDGEVNYFPESPAGNFGETEGLPGTTHNFQVVAGLVFEFQ